MGVSADLPAYRKSWRLPPSAAREYSAAARNRCVSSGVSLFGEISAAWIAVIGESSRAVRSVRVISFVDSLDGFQQKHCDGEFLVGVPEIRGIEIEA